MACDECTCDYRLRCPVCLGTMLAKPYGRQCRECGYVDVVRVSEDTLAMTEVLKIGERK